MTGSSVRIFKAHLWKELRENRGALIGVFAVILLGCPTLVFALHQFEVPMADLPALTALLASGLVAFSLGGELMGREVSSDRRAVISRLPGGLLRPFAARIVIYIATWVLAASFGSVWTLCSIEWIAESTLVWRWYSHYEWIMLIAMVGGFLPLASSCWLRQGMLAAPAAAILTGLLFLPLTHQVAGGRVVELLEDDMVLIGAIWIATGLLAAWFSFQRGLRRSGGRRAAIIAGITTVAIGAIPVYGLAVDRVRSWSRLDVGSDSFAISDGYLGVGACTAFLNVGHSWNGREKKPTHAVVVNLTDGTLRDLGPNTWWQPVAAPRWGEGIGTSTVPQSLTRLVSLEEPRLVHDGATSEFLFEAPTEESPEQSARLRQARFDASPVRLPDGRRAWAEPGGFFVGRPEDTGELHRIEERHWYWGASRGGFGLRTEVPGERHWARSYYNAQAGQVIDLPSREDHMVACVGPDLLVSSRQGRDRVWQLIGVEGVRSISYLSDQDIVHFELPDGSLLVSARIEETDKHGRRLWSVQRLNWETGTRSEMVFEDGSRAIVLGVWGSLHGNQGTTPEGHAAVMLSLEGKQVLARIDMAGNQLVRTSGSSLDRLIACVDEDSAIAIASRPSRIIRVHFGEATEEVLFPR